MYSHRAPGLHQKRARRRMMAGPPPDRSAQSHLRHATIREGGGEGGGGTQLEASQDEVRKYSAEGAQDSPREEGRSTQQAEDGGSPPLPHHVMDFSAPEGGRSPPQREAQT